MSAQHSLHHTHLFASNVDASIRFYEKHFGGEVVLDMDLAGARNVFMRVGGGRLHFYDQSPKDTGRGPIHHLGIRTADIASVVESLAADGIALPKGIRDYGFWRYVMVPAPDGVLLEVFEVDMEQLPEELRAYFD